MLCHAVQVLQEAERQEDEVQQRSGSADITAFLEPVALDEARHIRKLSNLCGLSYKPHLVTVRTGLAATAHFGCGSA